MNQVLEFGKRYGKWIAVGVVAAAVTVVGVVGYRSYMSDDEDYAEIEEGLDVVSETVVEETEEA